MSSYTASYRLSSEVWEPHAKDCELLTLTQQRAQGPVAWQGRWTLGDTAGAEDSGLWHTETVGYESPGFPFPRSFQPKLFSFYKFNFYKRILHNHIFLSINVPLFRKYHLCGAIGDSARAFISQHHVT